MVSDVVGKPKNGHKGSSRKSAAAPEKVLSEKPSKPSSAKVTRLREPRAESKKASETTAPRLGGSSDSAGTIRRRNADVPARIGRYEILERIGVGGMADAFRAKARGPGGYERELIIKSLLPELAGDSDFMRLFVAEAKILGLINHPNVVQVYDFGEADGRHFLALEYLDGPSVADILALLHRTGMSMPIGVAAFIAREVCLGLSAAHSLRGPDDRPLNVVHRDVTPSNVMTTTGGEVKLVDFGIARVGEPSTATRAGTVRGKPAYMAPEQIAGGQVDGRTDVFATGVLLYEMLTLKPLFLGENDLATVYQVMELEIPTPSSLRAGTPVELDKIVLRALERPPRLRYQTAQQMADELTHVVDALGVGRSELAGFARLFSEMRREAQASPRARIVASGIPPSLGEQIDEELAMANRAWPSGHQPATAETANLASMATRRTRAPGRRRTPDAPGR